MEPKILIGSPVFEGTRYCIKKFLESTKAISYPNKEILLVDNSRTGDFFNELKQDTEIRVIKDTTQETIPKKRLISSRNKIFKYALENNFEYVFMLDSDVTVPRSILQDLLKHEKDIISGIYFNYFKSSGQIKLLPVAWKSLTEKEFQELQSRTKLPRIVKARHDLRRHLTPEEIAADKLIEVTIPSNGCCLIVKKVFEKVRYGLLEVPNNLSTSDDIYFFQKAREAGFKCYVDTKQECGHMIKGKFKKDKEGNLIHPLSEEYDQIQTESQSQQ